MRLLRLAHSIWDHSVLVLCFSGLCLRASGRGEPGFRGGPCPGLFCFPLVFSDPGSQSCVSSYCPAKRASPKFMKMVNFCSSHLLWLTRSHGPQGSFGEKKLLWNHTVSDPSETPLTSLDASGWPVVWFEPRAGGLDWAALMEGFSWFQRGFRPMLGPCWATKIPNTKRKVLGIDVWAFWGASFKFQQKGFPVGIRNLWLKPLSLKAVSAQTQLVDCHWFVGWSGLCIVLDLVESLIV